jgi:hypothetical protein
MHSGNVGTSKPCDHDIESTDTITTTPEILTTSVHPDYDSHLECVTSGNVTLNTFYRMNSYLWLSIFVPTVDERRHSGKNPSQPT